MSLAQEPHALAIDLCSVTRLAGAVNVRVSTVSLAQQSHSETTCHPGEIILFAPWWPQLLRLCSFSSVGLLFEHPTQGSKILCQPTRPAGRVN